MDHYVADTTRMKLGAFRLAPPWWGIALFLLGAALFCALGVWQIERAHYKERLVAAQDAAREAGTIAITADTAPASGDGRSDERIYNHRVSATGQLQSDRQILLSDQLNGTRIGYRVWTPLRLDSGVRVMVDRGWVPRSSVHDPALPNPAAPDTRVQVTGFWVRFPQPALSWGASSDCSARGWPRLLSYPDAATVRCQYEAPVTNGLLLLDPEDSHGFVRNWDDERDVVGLPPFAHYAYASQWFLMALVAGVILVVVNLRRR